MRLRTSRRGWAIRIGGAVVALVALVGFVIPYVYVHFINKPTPHLTFEQLDAQRAKSGEPTSVSTSVDSAGFNGTWVSDDGSKAGYRVKETINGQSTEGVGQSSTVEGTVTIKEGRLSTADFSVDVASLKSDNGKRDAQFVGRIMNAEEFPVASFVATSFPPVEVPSNGATISVVVDGTLSLHGVEKAVSVSVVLRTQGDSVQIQGTVPILFADYQIENPSIGPISTGDSGEIEFLLLMRRS
jgi:polyisoprenoid-binding protein YceI